MRQVYVCLALLMGACAANDDTADERDPIVPDPSAGVDAALPPPAPDAALAPTPDAGPQTGMNLPAASACATGAECAGGTCLGGPGQLDEGNPRFAGGYCSAIGCTPNTQEGCGADEFCVESSEVFQGGYCVELCSKAEGLVCDRPDHVCLGLGAFGGCYSREAVECNVQMKDCPEPTQLCVRIGYEDKSLGRCETRCDPVAADCPRGDHACYYIKTYDAAFCGTPGIAMPEQSCSCDKCCVEDHACTPDLDGAGRHCKKVCLVADPDQCASGETCVPIEEGSPFGGCVAPGSAGT